MGMLDGRVVIVTGGGRGIGREHCLELAAHGATVVVNDLGTGVRGELREEAPADEVVAEIRARGGDAMADDSSVSDWDAMQRLVAHTVEAYGRLDGIVNTAGILRDRMLTSLTEDDIDAVLAVHLKGTIALTKHACDHWRGLAKAGEPVYGRVVNTTSGSGLFGNVGQSNYAAAKAGIAGFTIVAAMEMDRYGVTVNAISPLAATRMTAGSGVSGADDAPAAGWSPMDPGNASPVVAWLLSPAAGWLTGAVLRVEGNAVQRVRPWEIDDAVTYRSRSGERLTADELDVGLRRAFRLFPQGITSKPQ